MPLVPSVGAGETAGDKVAPPPVRGIVVVFKTHFDIGYMDFASNIVQRSRTTFMDQALEVVDRSRTLSPEQQFVWTLPGWPATKMLESWPGQTAERQARIRRAFAEGRFVGHALPGDPVPVENGRFTVTLKANAPTSFRFEPSFATAEW